MSRVKIKFPQDNPLFIAEVPVRITDVNYGGHVGNDSILSIIQEARVLFYQSIGYTELDLGGVGTIMADVSIAYKSEGFYGDIFEISIYVTDVSQYGFILLYKIMKKGETPSKDIAHASTSIVCFDYETRKVALIPNVVKNKLSIVKN
ncbi:MAG: thioesterase family protein [Flavipsychrobacter sp.]